MPELPEVETVRRTLEPHVLRRRIDSVRIRRSDVIDGPASPRDLLAGDSVASLLRRGKQLALVGAGGRVLLVQLGMTGSFVASTDEPNEVDPHIHVVWRLNDPKRPLWLRFRDPRRFGGLRTFPNLTALEQHWLELGPDALTIGVDQLASALGDSRRAVKAALLDQNALAGVGNIYADEALFLAGIRPTRRCDRLTGPEWARLANAIRAVLAASIARGGSTLRDFRSADDQAGAYQQDRLVYDRAGHPCARCARSLLSTRIAGRATVYCPTCQSARNRSSALIHQ